MWKFGKLVAVTILFSFVPAVDGAWAAPLPEAPLPAATVAGVSAAEPNATAEPPTTGALTTPRASIRDSLDALRLSPRLLLPDRRDTAQAAAQSGGGHGLSNGAKAAIWISAVTVAAVWGYKTFSVTRGTD